MILRTGQPVFLVAVLSLFFFFAHLSLAGATTADNVGGYAWSSNIGWIKLNNCTNPGDGSTCSGYGYGVSFLSNGSGTGSGYAWSSNIGWISFNAVSVSGCPAGFSQCTPYIDWATANADGSRSMKGWARACSVFRTGCSGALKSSTERGGWDGFIALGDTNTADGNKWGVTVGGTGSMSGFAWGSDVVGWVNFSGATLLISNLPFVDLTASPDTISAGDSSTLRVEATNLAGANACSGTTSAGGTWSVTMAQNIGINGWSGTLVVTPASTTTYTVNCTYAAGAGIGTDNATVTVIPVLGPAVNLIASTNGPVAPGTPVALTLQASSFATSISCGINQGVGAVAMSNAGGNTWNSTSAKTVNPMVTTSYTATCTGPSGSANDTEVITVNTSVSEICGNGIDDDGDTLVDEGCSGAPQCSDGIDNPDTEDTLADAADPGCHSDGNAGNAASYVPSDTDEQDKKKPIFIEF